MSHASDKLRNMKTTLKRHQADIDEKLVTSVGNDFLQLSQILEVLKATDNKSHGNHG